MVVERPSDREYACFFCGQGQAKDLTAVCPACANPLDVGQMFKGQKVDDYSLIQYVGRGFYGATYHAVNRIGKEFAVKITPTILYSKHKRLLQKSSFP